MVEKYLRYEREHNLGKMPLKIDFLVIRKKTDVVIKNDIGDFFLGNNIFEYKSPGDDMNIGTFYKVLSYACLYKYGLHPLHEPSTGYGRRGFLTAAQNLKMTKTDKLRIPL